MSADNNSLDFLYASPGYLIRRCHQISVAIFLEECAQFNIRPLNFAVLCALTSHQDVDQITLAGLIGVDRSTIARLVTDLEEKGLVNRKDSSKDRRVRLVHLTRKGKTLVNKAVSTGKPIEDRILEPLTKTQRKQFLSCLDKIAQAHNEISRAPLKSIKSSS
jgi:DNA-binding MarR family transcriptional regulator